MKVLFSQLRATHMLKTYLTFNYNIILEEKTMREKERDSRERNHENLWTTVSRKKPKPRQTHATKMCFVNHLPLNITISEISHIFRTHGAIAAITIPTTQKHSNHIFAFVQYYYPQSLTTAVRDENGKKVGDTRITIYPAKYDKPQTPINNPNQPRKPQPRIIQDRNHPKQKNHKSQIRDNRSYKKVTKPPHTTMFTENQSPQKNQPPETQSNLNQTPPKQTTKPEPSKHRIMSSRVLGEDTEKTRKNLKPIEIESGVAAALDGIADEETAEKLERSVIGIVEAAHSHEVILEHILSEGVNCLTIESMGGSQHLITFNTLEDKKSIIESQWLERWYMVLKNVNSNSAALWRETWISVYGVPLIGWNYKYFFDIGCVLGKVLSVNYKSLECARILILTDCLFDINAKISICIGDKRYSIYVSEKQQLWNPTSSGENGNQNVTNEGNPS